MTPIDKTSLLFRHCKTEEAYLNARARIDRDRKDKTAAARAAMDAYDRRGRGDDAQAELLAQVKLLIGLVAELLQAQKGADLEFFLHPQFKTMLLTWLVDNEADTRPVLEYLARKQKAKLPIQE